MNVRPSADAVDRPLLGASLLLLAGCLFVLNDGAAKYLAQSMSPEQIIWARYAVISFALLPVVLRRGGTSLLRTSRPVLHVARGLLLMVSAILFVSALRHLPLELCTAIGFVSPLYVTALSIPLLGERVGVRRWTAVGGGFLAVVLILRPTGAQFQWAMLLPLVSSLCWALGLIFTRVMRTSERPMTVLVYSAFVGFVASTPIALPVWQSTDAVGWTLLLGIGVLNALAQYLVIRAFMMTSASFLAPFSYSTIVWAVLVGFLVFDSLPDLWTVAGTLGLTSAGLYVWHRERVISRRIARTGALAAESAETPKQGWRPAL